jgi:hypothetical protein
MENETKLNLRELIQAEEEVKIEMDLLKTVFSD